MHLLFHPSILPNVLALILYALYGTSSIYMKIVRPPCIAWCKNVWPRFSRTGLCAIHLDSKVSSGVRCPCWSGMHSSGPTLVHQPSESHAIVLFMAIRPSVAS
ncbi:hypothetical protein H4582DRAFT_1916378 [Lactarius indigo]|nr:hypothetical protein H4582DRAFT_1916378 [Lactarius indigo]